MGPGAGISGRIQFNMNDEELIEDCNEESATPTLGEGRKLLGLRGGAQLNDVSTF